MEREEIIKWLLEGDVAIQYQTHRDLIGSKRSLLDKLKSRISEEGCGSEILKKQNPEGYWGQRFYQPKWTSTHYTLLDLRNLCCPRTDEIEKALNLIMETCLGKFGEINGFRGTEESDICVNGMFLNYACYFGIEENKIRNVIDFIISLQLADGGFNCFANRMETKHSSLHSTISVLEGIREYLFRGYQYRSDELLSIEKEASEFILRHRLFRSERTGEIINKGMLRMVYPSRWRYDILRALEYFRSAGFPYDERMNEALELIVKKRRPDGRWKIPGPHPGAVHIQMEKDGEVSRWNTLRAMRVLEYYHRL